MIRFGLIAEGKYPPDRRVVLTPDACASLLNYPGVEIYVAPSVHRAFPDSAYAEVGAILQEDLSVCDVLLGVKEVPIEQLIPGKKYFFFSHTIKKQSYNRALLQAILAQGISLFDHEVIVDQNGQRLVAFGYYAGVVGAYHAIRTYGLKHGLFELAKPSDLADINALKNVLREINLPPVKIVLTGKGRVGSGAAEVLDAMGLPCVDPEDFLVNEYPHAVYTAIDVCSYVQLSPGSTVDKQHFFAHPELYANNFFRWAAVSDLFIAGHYYGKGAPMMLDVNDLKDPSLKLSVIADISCDIGAPIASTLRSSTISDPIYGVNPRDMAECDWRSEDALAVMAVDNLPCEVPVDASSGFSIAFSKYVLPAFFDGDQSGVLARAQITTADGKLTPRFSYLEEYVAGK
jgi:saccharopine dehydrogenase (NAD+, L-lysine-forming)